MASSASTCGASGWVADFGDATTPTWQAVVEGQLTLIDALDGVLSHTGPDARRHELGGALPAIHVRPRGWHLAEKHLRLDCRPLSASVVDAGLFLFHSARRQLDRGSGPYLYLPKLEGAAEAALWRRLLHVAEDRLGLPRGTVRTTVLIETLPAAFEMEEILHALGPYASALSAGGQDYLFSVVKTFSAGRSPVLPDRSALTTDVPFLRACTDLLVHTAHRRGAHAIGGTAASVPGGPGAERTARAWDEVRQNAQRQVRDAFDGSCVTHPGVVATCRDVFDAALGDAPNQLHRDRPEVRVRAADLLDLPSAPGRPTALELRRDISVALRYLSAWLGGSGATAIDSSWEDAATVESIRSQVWQHVRAGTDLDDNTPVTPDLVTDLSRREAERLAATHGGGPWLDDALALLLDITTDEEFAPFFTTIAYGRHIARSEVTGSTPPAAITAHIPLTATSGQPPRQAVGQT
jgi:malate synthase